jgi:signal transduction histidine kinase
MTHFRTNVLLKSIIGKDLITDDNIAVLELVKNSFDAGSKKVVIKLLNLKKNDDNEEGESPTETNSKIIVEDTGSGMSEKDIEDKWLNIAYSEKKQNREQFGRLLAGNKGVGRFSCDKLGRYLNLYTRKKNNSYVHLFIDWSKFEIENEKDLEIQKIPIVKEIITPSKFKSQTGFAPFENGTILEISNLREPWNVAKIITLRRNLEKLINPNQAFRKSTFEIEIVAEEFKKDDKGKEDFEKVNGKVKNKIFEKLNFRTSSIDSFIDSKGKTITTTLQDRGREIFSLVERNPFNLLKSIRAVVYYLNPYSKIYFTKQTGIRSVDFGSIFLFINGFRVPPYGDEGDDWIGLEARKGQGHSRFLGTREVVGRIEIQDDDRIFRIISNRSGVVNDEPFVQLTNATSPYGYFMKTFRRLERFVVEGIKWDSAAEDERKLEKRINEDPNWSKDNEVYVEDRLIRNTRALRLIHRIIDARKDDIIKLTINEEFVLEIIQEQTQKAKDELNKILKELKSKEYSSSELSAFIDKLGVKSDELKFFSETLGTFSKDIPKSEIRSFERLKSLYAKNYNALKELKRKLSEAEQKQTKLEEELELEKQKNTYFHASDRTMSEEAKGLIHNVKITAKRINSNIDTLYEKILSDRIKKEEILLRLGTIKYNAEKAIKITQLITRANFKSQADKQYLDISKYIKQYIDLYSDIYESNQLKFDVNNEKASLERRLSILDLSLVFDNLISNSEKSGASKVQVDVSNSTKEKLKIVFSDNGKGVDKKFLDKIEQIFELGVTTTDGSGIGLHSIKKTLDDMNATIKFAGNGKVLKGASFQLEFN